MSKKVSLANISYWFFRRIYVTIHSASQLLRIGDGCSMITITRLNDQDMIINCDLIELIESTPDTTITMTTGRKILIKEDVDEVLEKITTYKKRIL